MQQLRLLAALALSGFGLYGCQTSCGEKREPVLWADGITKENSGQKVYQTTEIDDAWLHFPSHRRFRLPHKFGTKEIGYTPYISFDETPNPKSDKELDTEFTVASGNAVVIVDATDDEIVVENGTCENDYYLFVRITDMSDD